MLKNSISKVLSALTFCAALALSGCGGGEDQGATQPTPNAPPAPNFVSPVSIPFSVDVPGGGGFGYYATGRPAGLNNHYGIDLDVDIGTEVKASRGGTVRRASTHPCLGELVIVEHDPVVGRGILYTLYAHLSSIDVALGDRVEQYARLGASGNTGTCTTGPHLHFEFVETPDSLVWGTTSGQPTGHSPNYDRWQDPALNVEGWSGWVGPGPRLVSLTIEDSDFAQWTPYFFVTDDLSVSIAGPGASSGSASRVVTGGNPDAYLAIAHTVYFGDVIWTGAIKSDFVYSPKSSGAIASLNISLDLSMFDYGASSWQLVVEQGGRRFFSGPYGAFSGFWSGASTSHLVASNFDTNPMAGLVGVSADGHQPDFSVSGGPMKFGVQIGNGRDGSGSGISRHGIDNFLLTINR